MSDRQADVVVSFDLSGAYVRAQIVSVAPAHAHYEGYIAQTVQLGYYNTLKGAKAHLRRVLKWKGLTVAFE